MATKTKTGIIKAAQRATDECARADLNIARDAAKASGSSMMDELFERLGRQVLNRETLHTRGSDGLDFAENGVWQIREALERAFEAGKAAQRDAQKAGR